jgi:hypothetical protein
MGAEGAERATDDAHDRNGRCPVALHAAWQAQPAASTGCIAPALGAARRPTEVTIRRASRAHDGVFGHRISPGAVRRLDVPRGQSKAHATRSAVSVGFAAGRLTGTRGTSKADVEHSPRDRELTSSTPSAMNTAPRSSRPPEGAVAAATAQTTGRLRRRTTDGHPRGIEVWRRAMPRAGPDWPLEGLQEQTRRSGGACRRRTRADTPVPRTFDGPPQVEDERGFTSESVRHFQESAAC